MTTQGTLKIDEPKKFRCRINFPKVIYMKKSLYHRRVRGVRRSTRSKKRSGGGLCTKYIDNHVAGKISRNPFDDLFTLLCVKVFAKKSYKAKANAIMQNFAYLRNTSQHLTFQQRRDLAGRTRLDLANSRGSEWVTDHEDYAIKTALGLEAHSPRI